MFIIILAYSFHSSNSLACAEPRVCLCPWVFVQQVWEVPFCCCCHCTEALYEINHPSFPSSLCLWRERIVSLPFKCGFCQKQQERFVGENMISLLHVAEMEERNLPSCLLWRTCDRGYHSSPWALSAVGDSTEVSLVTGQSKWFLSLLLCNCRKKGGLFFSSRFFVEMLLAVPIDQCA